MYVRKKRNMKRFINFILFVLIITLFISCSSTFYNSFEEEEKEPEIINVEPYVTLSETPTIIECKRHDYNIEYVYPKSCKESGYTLMICTICGHQETVIWDKNNPNNVTHNYEVIEEVHPSHCGEIGYTLMRCKDCGETKKEEVILEHDYHVIEKKEHTCYQSGYLKKECSVCGKIDIEYIPSGHTFIWKDTCFIDYYEEYCIDCHKYSGRIKDHGKIYQL